MKLREFQAFCQAQKIQKVFLMVPDVAVTYFTHIEPSHGFLIIEQKRASLWLSKLDKKPRLKEIDISLLEKGYETKIKDEKVKKVGINKVSLTVAQLDWVKKLFPKAKFVDISKKLIGLRKEKTPQEISYMRKACKITSDALRALTKELPKKNLTTEQDVAFFLEKYIKSHEAALAFPTIVAIGKNAATPHHITSTSPLTRGFLLLDFGARYKQYCADMTRCIFLGTPNNKEKDLYNLLLKAQKNAIKEVKEGISFKELDSISRKVLGKLSNHFVHSLGHGIGLEVHESPVFSDKKEFVAKNIPFTIEPGVYLPHKKGLRIEDTVIWNGKKVEILTTARKELICIPHFK